MLIRSSFVLTLAIASPAAAQAPGYYVSPPGIDTFEHSAAVSTMFGRNTSRVQQSDISFVGQDLRVVKSIGWRQDGLVTTSGNSRTVEFEILMAHSDWARRGRTFSQNYLGKATTVYPKQRVNLNWPRRLVAAAPAHSASSACVPRSTPSQHCR